MTSVPVETLSNYELAMVRALRLLPAGMKGKSRLVHSLARFVKGRRDVIIETQQGDRLIVPSLDEPIAFSSLFDGVYEPEVHAILEEYLPVGGVFLDVGANVGVFTVPASRIVGAAGRVIGIEASPEINAYLSRNIALNGCANVSHVKRAATDNGPRKLSFWAAPADKFGMGSLAAQFQSEPVEIEADTIDHILATLDVSRVDLIKIDIEGFEAAAFEGARNLLTAADRPAIIFEFLDWAEKRAGAEPGDAQKLLLDLGYVLHEIGTGGRLRKLDAPLTRGGANLLALAH